MKKLLVITVTSADRPGIVEQVTRVVAEHGGNWEESRMARLGGVFAGIVQVGVPAERAEELKQALESLSGQQLTVSVQLTQPDVPETPSTGQILNLELSGADHEGIVHEVAAYLAEQGANVEEMETEVVSAPVSGSPLFQMKAKVKIPTTLELDDLRKQLDELAHKLGVDIHLR